MADCTLRSQLEHLREGESHVLAERIPLDEVSKKRIQIVTDKLSASARRALHSIDTTAEYKVENLTFLTTKTKDVMILAIVTKTGVDI